MQPDRKLKAWEQAGLVELEPTNFVSERLAKALASPLRVRILDTLNRHTMSVTGFIAAFPQYSHPQVYRQFRTLERLECIEFVEEKTGGNRRGGRERFFRATARSLFDESGWASLPDSVKNKITSSVFSTYIDRVADATRAGTIDRRPDRHFTWSDPYFDEQAWDETVAEVDAVFHRIAIREAEAKARMGESGEKPIPVTVALACFESPDPPAPRD